MLEALGLQTLVEQNRNCKKHGILEFMLYCLYMIYMIIYYVYIYIDACVCVSVSVCGMYFVYLSPSLSHINILYTHKKYDTLLPVL